MEANKILQSSFLDLLFEGRNKSYGAYDLRRTYNSRVIKALLYTATFLVACILLSSFANRNKILDKPEIIDVFTTHIDSDPIIPEPRIIVPTVLKPAAAAAKQQIFVPPIIVADNIVRPEEKVETLQESVAIGTENIKTGSAIKVIQPPVSETGSTVGKIAIAEKETDEPFRSVEIEASFPGGTPAWQKFLQNNIDPNTPVNAGAKPGSYTVLVQFVVDVNGQVSDVKALTNTGFGMEKEAVKAISKGPKWIPALQNGRYVKAYRNQPVTFLVPED